MDFNQLSGLSERASWVWKLTRSFSDYSTKDKEHIDNEMFSEENALTRRSGAQSQEEAHAVSSEVSSGPILSQPGNNNVRSMERNKNWRIPCALLLVWHTANRQLLTLWLSLGQNYFIRFSKKSLKPLALTQLEKHNNASTGTSSRYIITVLLWPRIWNQERKTDHAIYCGSVESKNNLKLLSECLRTWSCT